MMVIGSARGRRVSRQRFAPLQPFTSSAPLNVSVGSGALFEAAADAKTAAFIAHTPELNSTNWAVAIAYATTTDPTCNINDPVSGILRGTCQIPTTTTPPGGTDKHVAVVQPDNSTVYECYRMTNVDSTHWTAERVVVTDLTGTGLVDGVRASGTSILMGLIRAEEVAGFNIPHTIYFSLPNERLVSGFVWPARNEDSDAATAYTGVVPMGTMLAIPSSTDLSALSLSAEGMALAVCLQDYGGHVMIRGDNASVYVDPAADQTAVARMRTDWKNTLHSLVRVVTNNTALSIAGGGTRRRPDAWPVSVTAGLYNSITSVSDYRHSLTVAGSAQ